MPLAVVCTILYCGLVYLLCGLNDAGLENLGYFVLVVIICNLIGLSFCQVSRCGGPGVLWWALLSARALVG